MPSRPSALQSTEPVKRILPPRPVRAVIFDMDGVLVDSQPLFFDFEAIFFESLGIPLTLEENHGLVGMSLGVMFDHLRETRGLSMPREECLDRYRLEVVKFFEKVPTLDPIEGVNRLIGSIAAAQIPMAVASSSPMGLIDLILGRTGLRSFFAHVVSGDQVGLGKPHPDIFLKTAELMGADPGECLVFEDSRHGVAAGLAAGMMVVGYENPGSGIQDISGAHWIIRHFDEADLFLAPVARECTARKPGECAV